MPLLILLVLGLIVAVIWLAIRQNETHTDAASLQRQADQLGNRVVALDRELTKLKAAAPVEARESEPPLVQVSSPAPSAPRAARVEALPPPLPPMISPATAVAAKLEAVEPKPAETLSVSAPIAPSAPPPLLPPPPSQINWEQFLGVKLFMWVGGFALFLAVAFALKYSFDQGWISPPVRVGSGIVLGIGLILGGLRIPRERYAVTAHTFCAAGVLVLYASIFAAHAFYRLIESNTLTFGLMAIVTAAAFTIAVKRDAQVVAVLGLLGGFLTPPLLSTGVDRAFGLFSYVALLDIGLLAVAMRKRWHYLALLGAFCTVLTEFAWTGKFFEDAKIHTAIGIYLAFVVLFTVGLAFAAKRNLDNAWTWAAALLPPSAAFLFAFSLLGSRHREIAAQPGLLFSFVFLVDAALLAIVVLRDRLRLAQFAGGAATGLLLSIWTMVHMKEPQLNWALGFYLLFAVLHSGFPVVLTRWRPGAAPGWWSHLFPPVALMLVMLPIMKLNDISLLVWPVVLLVDALAIGLAVLTGSIIAIVVVLLLTVAATALWLLRVPVLAVNLPEELFVIGGFAVFFFVIGIFASRKIVAKFVNQSPTANDGTTALAASAPFTAKLPPEMVTQVPALSAIMPFLLLLLMVARLDLKDPTPIFGLAALLVVMLFGLIRWLRVEWLGAIGLVCVLLLEHAWHERSFDATNAMTPLLWNAGFALAFFAFPFVFQNVLRGRVVPWAVAALALPLHFYIFYNGFDRAWPDAEWPGLVPAAFALPVFIGLRWLVQIPVEEEPERTTLLAFFGGATLFFVTLIVPIQFDREWITLGWAVEGAALLWLFHRMPHNGLRIVGVGLLVVAFVRLALNPAVLGYHDRTGTPIWNWYLYAYGLTTLCLWSGARLLAAPRNVVLGSSAPPLLWTLGTVLAFLLVNIEIADYFSTGTTVTFQFHGNLARDMAYSIAWALFALVLLAVGVKVRSRGARYAGLGLLVVTIGKIFLHDLWSLGGLYRVGSLIGLATVLILVSVIYQKWVAPMTKEENDQ